MQTLSEWRKPDTTFTLKSDFNMAGFLIRTRPDEAFEAENEKAETYIRTNTTSNISLKDNVELKPEDLKRLIEAGRKTFIYYKNLLRLDVYNVPELEDQFKLVNEVADF